MQTIKNFMRKGTYCIILPALMITLVFKSANAQTLKDGLREIDNERYHSAEQMLSGLIAKNPSAELYFYLGNVYLKTNQPDLALKQFTKGIEVNALSPLNHIGLGSIALNKKDTVSAKASFDKALAMTPKDVNVMIAVAQANIEAKYPRINYALSLLAKATSLDKRNARIYYEIGNAYYQRNEGGPAVTNYEKVIEIDSLFVKAYNKIGIIYTQARNYEVALKALQNALRIDPNFAPAYWSLGELQYMGRKYDKAKEAYTKYLELSEKTVDNQIRFAKVLFLSKDYTGTVKIISELMQKDSSNSIMYRLLGYSSYETGNYPDGLYRLEKFFQMAEPDQIIPSDYEYYGKLLAKNGKDSLGIDNIIRSIQMDSTKVELYGDIADIYYKGKKYAEAGQYFELKTTNAKGNLQDYFLQGRAYYNAALSVKPDSIPGKKVNLAKPDTAVIRKATAFYLKADSAFSKISEKQPELPVGYLWRAKCNVGLDPETTQGLAMPYYQKYVEIAAADPKTKKEDLIGAYHYLGYYYFLKKDCATALTEFEKIIALDPQNEKAKTVIKAIKTEPCK
jgi:tetratricopeptide (TPR) repeat protein